MDLIKANDFYAKSCQLGYSTGCDTIEEMKNKTKNTDHFHEALNKCNSGDNNWCGALGVDYMNGTGVKRDSTTALKYLDEACDAGSNWSCGWLGVLYSKGGSGVPRDYFEALSAFKKACDAKLSVYCIATGNLYKNGQGARLDLDKAAEFYGKACDMKDQQGCESYRELKSPQPVQQAVNNFSNSNYQQEQLNMQRQQLKLQQEQNLQNQLNGMQQQNQFQSQQNAQYLRNLGY